MSSIIWHPGQLNGLQPTEGDGEVSFDTDGSIMITRVWICAYKDAFSLCPRPRDSAPAGTPGVSTKCITSGYRRMKPDAALVTSVYQGIWNMPFTVYQMDASRYEKPIVYHPAFNNPAIFGDYVGSTSQYTQTKLTRGIVNPSSGVIDTYVFDKFKDIGAGVNDPSCIFRGIEAYMVATATFRKTSYALAPDFMLSKCFVLDNPETGGLSIPDPSNEKKSWLKADKTCRNMYRGASQIWEIQESWLYNANGWLPQIYNPPSYS